jgi:hypothetical protein
MATPVLDHQCHPARNVVALYHQRREIDTV